MRFDRTRYKCGVLAIANALEALGEEVSVPHLSQLAGTTKEGTGEDSLRHTLRELGYDTEVIDTPDYENARRRLSLHVGLGGPAILATENGQHWVTVIGKLGNGRVIVFDPQRAQWNRKTGGTYVLDGDDLKGYWGRSPSTYYALLVTP